MTSGSQAERIADTARHLQETHDDPEATWQTAVEVMQESVDGCDGVGLSMVHRRREVTTVAATCDLAREADRLQYELGEGPCLDAVWERHIVRSRDLAADRRWPTWGPRVADATEARSIVCYQLFTNEDRIGALNLYSRSLDAFDDRTVEEGYAIAAHVSIAVAASQEVDALTQGLASRTVIGQATGMLMERYDLDPARAFSVLSRMSQEGNIKLRTLAEQIVEHRRDGLGEARPQQPLR
ncbi:transcriptional regulator with GAF, ATPase, and Fis domain [Nocardioides cavernae]|uniref:Transcriptional regulator with GAF, ATPase, and Fis domain n=1 Tax=Nocardioides cavernae TaxID=1921566 RepID=A0A7Y9H648_9ACTN|nr:GAF and ANTAR domain-containing protein [Nocardioides cavernae]NYE38610.1 transcriptional regulator with GAF, ATPase, and Fis domain [Nocardioides cavernae]